MGKQKFKPQSAEYYYDRAKTKARQNKGNLRLLIFIIFAFIAGVFGGITGANIQSDDNALTSTRSGRQVISSESELITTLAKDVGPGVVSVNVLGQQTTGIFGGVQQEQGAGTGFILDSEGIIATNRHVVGDNPSSVSVTLSDGTELENVEVIGATSANDPLDIAFLKIKDKEGKSLAGLPLGDSSEVNVGQRVAAIGNALGQFQNTVTTGIISGYGRDIEASSDGFTTETLQNLFQTDAAINQGNSGGPLVNMNGEVIGMNTAVAGGGAENIGFAIPIDDLKGLIRSVLEKGKLERPYLGVRYVSITDDYAYEYNLEKNRGAYVLPGLQGERGVLSGSPADKAGIREKDIITHVDGEPVNERNSLISLVSKHQVGEKFKLTIIRNGNEKKVDVKLEAAD